MQFPKTYIKLCYLFFFPKKSTEQTNSVIHLQFLSDLDFNFSVFASLYLNMFLFN